MDGGIHKPTDLEKKLAAQIRSFVVTEIAKRDQEEVAELFGLAPTGLESLLWEKKWSLNTGIRAIDLLGIDIKFGLRRRRMMSDQQLIKRSVHLSPEITEALDKCAKEHGITKSEALRLVLSKEIFPEVQ